MNIENLCFKLEDLAGIAASTIEANKDTFIGQYILQNPHVKVKDVIFCYRQDINGDVQFYIKESEK